MNDAAAFGILGTYQIYFLLLSLLSMHFVAKGTEGSLTATPVFFTLISDFNRILKEKWDVDIPNQLVPWQLTVVDVLPGVMDKGNRLIPYWERLG